MGIRMDQFMGLNAWAQNFVRGETIICTEKVTRIYPDGREEVLPDRQVELSLVTREPSGKFYFGMFEEQYPLFKYAFPDGRVCEEEVQARPWSSGPVFFLALKDENGDWLQESLWSDADIEAA